MTDDIRSEEPTDPQFAAVRELAGLWVRSQPIVSAYITANVFDIHHAEDLVQEVAQTAAEKFATFDRSRSFVSWALGIARNRLLKYYRTRSRERLVLSESALTRLESALEKVEHEVEDRRAALRICLERVAGRRREVLEMRYSESTPVSDIATRFGMTADGVFVMLHRIRTALYECIHRQLASEGAQ
jgi:RNA polymerase sigma-70 factor, ECF subfamily